jgi:RNAse (barnase) inhibitor barstar
MYMPWAAEFQKAFQESREAVEKEFHNLIAVFGEIDCELESIFRSTSFAKFGAPVHRQFDYPSDKRRSKQTTEIMRRSEQNLDIFWNYLDAKYHRKAGKLLDQTVQHILKADRRIERTPE